MISEEDKKLILTRLNAFEPSQLIKYIEGEDISFDEMRSAGLDHKKQEEIRVHLERAAAKEKELEFAW